MSHKEEGYRPDGKVNLKDVYDREGYVDGKVQRYDEAPDSDNRSGPVVPGHGQGGSGH